MKSTKWIISALLTLTLCAPAFAQTKKTTDTQTLKAKIERAAIKAQKKAAKKEARKNFNPNDPSIAGGDGAEAGWMWVEVGEGQNTRDGYEPNFFCVAADSDMQDYGGGASAPALTEVNPSLVYRAEEMLQRDRDLHGGVATKTLEQYVQQLIAEEEAAKKDDNKCMWCGRQLKKLETPTQCSADPDVQCMAFPSADPHANGTDQKAAPAVKQEKAQPAVCPTCGAAYTIDELYHGTPHECAQQVKKAKTAKKTVSCTHKDPNWIHPAER